MNEENEQTVVINGVTYTTKGEFRPLYDDASKETIDTELKISTDETLGKGRQDKSVYISNQQGEKKTSSIMMGYNKDGLLLGDGTFASTDELVEAIARATESLSPGEIIVNSKKEVLNPEQLINVSRSVAGKIVIGGPSKSITNQDTKSLGIESKNDVVSKGFAFLGNSGIKLPSGDYVNREEFEKAINDYMIMLPKQEKEPIEEGLDFKPEPKKEEKSNIVRVVRKYKNKLSAYLAGAAAVLTLVSGFKMVDKQQVVTVEKTMPITIMEEQETIKAKFEIGGIEYVYDPQAAIMQQASSFNMGDKVAVHDGQTFNTNSIETGRNETIGEGNFKRIGKNSGDYMITGFSVVNDGKIMSAIENFNGDEMQANLQTFIDQTLKKYPSLKADDINIMINLGSLKDKTALGWINVSEIIKGNTVDQDKLFKVAKEVSKEKGKQDFNGSTITLKNGATINVVDENNGLIKSGTHVIASDGKEYVINDLMISSEKEQKPQERMETVTTKETVTKKALTWSISNCELEQAIVPLLGAVAAEVAVKMKNKKLEENPYLDELKDEKEYEKFKEKFEETKKSYEKESKFKKLINRLFPKVDHMKRLTDEQSKEMHGTIDAYASKNGLSTDTKIEHGRITVGDKNITEQVMPYISEIGKNQPVEAEGLLEDDQQGFHR